MHAAANQYGMFSKLTAVRIWLELTVVASGVFVSD